MQAKTGKADSLAKLCEDLLNVNKRFKPIHPAFYLALKDNHFKVKVTHDLDDKVHIVFVAGEELRPIAEGFFATFKKFGFDKVGDRGCSFRANLDGDKTCRQIIERFIDKKCDFYQSFQQDSTFKLRFPSECNAQEQIDLFMDLAAENNQMPQLSDFDDVQIQANLDLFDEDRTNSKKKSWQFETIENFFDKSVKLFSGFNFREQKQLIKVINKLQEKMVQKIELSFSIDQVLELKSSIRSNDLLELFDFIVLFPDRNNIKEVNSYLNNWKQTKLAK